MIDEKKLIEDLKAKVYPEKFGEKCNAIDVISGVLQVIDEQPKTDWIPCEVEQPKEYGNYLYTDKNGEVHEGCYSPPNIGMINCWSTCEAFGFVRLSDDDVIAWQPLPEPYKKEGAE